MTIVLIGPDIARAPSESSTDGVHSATCIIISTPSAWRDSFSSRVCAWIASSCSRGFASPIGNGMIHDETRFANFPRSCSVRTETGEDTRKSIVAGFTLRLIR